jgi:hypothetical protein
VARTVHVDGLDTQSLLGEGLAQREQEEAIVID